MTYDDLAPALDRLEEGDRAIHAFVPEPDRKERVLSEAALSAQQEDGITHRPLAGALTGIKDLIRADGLPTRAGSPIPATAFEGPEAAVVRRLRDAGALIAGKTTTTELAFSEPGPTRNPRSLERTPGGSSSGSAAAVAAGLVPFAIGTQTVDSIVTPAAYCGVVGFKPTYGRAPVDGVIPFSPSMDTVGLTATTVDMARLVASVVCDEWDRNPPMPDLVLGVPAGEYRQRAGHEANEVVDAVVELLRTRGFVTVETTAISDIEAITRAHRRLVAAEFARAHADLFSRYGDRLRPRTVGFFAEGDALPHLAIVKGRAGGIRLMRSLEDTMQQEGITAWVAPAATGVAPVGVDYIGDPIMATPWTHAHLPVVTLPVIPASEGLPLGVQLIGRLGRDEELLRLSARVEADLRDGPGLT